MMDTPTIEQIRARIAARSFFDPDTVTISDDGNVWARLMPHRVLGTAENPMINIGPVSMFRFGCAPFVD